MAFFRGTGGADTATFQQLPLAIDEGELTLLLLLLQEQVYYLLMQELILY